MNGLQKVIKYCAMAFAIFLAVGIFGTIIAVITGVATGIAGVSRLTETEERINLSEQYSPEEIRALEINEIYVDCSAEIVVEQGNVLSAEAFNVTDEYEISCANGTVSVVQDKPNINFSFVWFDDVKNHEKVVITVPKDFSAEKIRINSGSGAVALKNVKADQLLLDSGSGRVELTGCYAEETDLKTGSGRVSADDTVLGKLSLNSGSGSVRMKNVLAKDAMFDSGSGSISYTGKMMGDCEFETGSGALNLSLEGQEDEYLVKAECGSGTFRINGKKVEDGSYGSNVKGTLDIDSGSGSVNVEFNTPTEE